MSGLDGAKAFVAKNKVVLGLGGAAAVAGLALVHSKGKSSTSSSGATSTVAGNGASTGAAGVYDSSSSDVYNALQPMLEKTSTQYDSLMEWLRTNGGLGPTPTPVPAVETPAVPEITTPKANPYTDFLGALTTPNPTSNVGSSITTNYDSPTSSIYNVTLGGVSRPIAEDLVWGGKFNRDTAGTAVAGYSVAESDAIREALRAKGL